MALLDVTNTIQHVQSYVAFEGEHKPRRHRGSAEPIFKSALESLESGLETNENEFRVFTDCEHSTQVVTSWTVPATFVDLAWIHAKFQKQDLDAVRVRVGGGVFAKFPSEEVSAEQGVHNFARGEVTKIHRDGTLEVKWANARLSNVPREWVRFVSRSRLTTRGAFAVLERLSAMRSPVEFLIEEFLHDGVYEYTADIFQCMRRAQERRPLNPDFMRTQPHLDTRMRPILNDWLFEVHRSFRFRMETLFLAVACTDRYLSRNVVRRQNFQLVGLTAMFIAAKVEEIVVPALGEFVRVTGGAYTHTDVLRMECGMLTCVCGDIACPTAAHFLKTFIDVGRCTDTLHCELAHYITTLTILDSSMLRFSPSCIAAAALSLSSDVLSQHRHVSCCANEPIQTCVPELRALLKFQTLFIEHGRHCSRIARAFSRKSHHCIAIKAAQLLDPAFVIAAE